LPADEPMRSLLVGRMLWSLTASAECLVEPDDRCVQIKASVIDHCLQALQSCDVTSVRLIGTKALVKFARKMPLQSLQSNAHKFDHVLKPLLGLLETADQDTIHLPIEAFQTFSKVNQETVSQMAPLITPKLLAIFKTEHSEGNLG
jgi:hypothetical protein